MSFRVEQRVSLGAAILAPGPTGKVVVVLHAVEEEPLTLVRQQAGPTGSVGVCRAPADRQLLLLLPAVPLQSAVLQRKRVPALPLPASPVRSVDGDQVRRATLEDAVPHDRAGVEPEPLKEFPVALPRELVARSGDEQCPFVHRLGVIVVVTLREVVPGGQVLVQPADAVGAQSGESPGGVALLDHVPDDLGCGVEAASKHRLLRGGQSPRDLVQHGDHRAGDGLHQPVESRHGRLRSADERRGERDVAENSREVDSGLIAVAHPRADADGLGDGDLIGDHRAVGVRLEVQRPCLPEQATVGGSVRGVREPRLVARRAAGVVENERTEHADENHGESEWQCLSTLTSDHHRLRCKKWSVS